MDGRSSRFIGRVGTWSPGLPRVAGGPGRTSLDIRCVLGFLSSWMESDGFVDGPGDACGYSDGAEDYDCPVHGDSRFLTRGCMVLLARCLWNPLSSAVILAVRRARSPCSAVTFDSSSVRLADLLLKNSSSSVSCCCCCGCCWIGRCRRKM